MQGESVTGCASSVHERGRFNGLVKEIFNYIVQSEARETRKTGLGTVIQDGGVGNILWIKSGESTFWEQTLTCYHREGHTSIKLTFAFCKTFDMALFVCLCCIEAMDFLGLLVKNLPASAGDAGSIPEWGRSPGGGNGNPLQCSCLENSRDRGAWLTTVHGVTKSQIWLSNQACTMNKCSLSECLHHKMAYTIFFYPRITWKIFQLTVGLHG